MGGADYAEVAPPHSVIDVSNFRSPRHLAEFLLRLDRDDDAYREYFRWKQDFRYGTSGHVVSRRMRHALRSCEGQLVGVFFGSTLHSRKM